MTYCHPSSQHHRRPDTKLQRTQPCYFNFQTMIFKTRPQITWKTFVTIFYSISIERACDVSSFHVSFKWKFNVYRLHAQTTAILMLTICMVDFSICYTWRYAALKQLVTEGCTKWRKRVQNTYFMVISMQNTYLMVISMQNSLSSSTHHS